MRIMRLDEKGESLAESLVTFFIAVMCAFMILSAVRGGQTLIAAAGSDAEKTYEECFEIERFVTGDTDADRNGRLIIKCGGVTSDTGVEIKKSGDLFAFRKK